MNGPGHGLRARGVALLERHETLPADPSSARQARRLLRDALAEVERDRWADVGELAISEIVTNASLHAHTTIELKLDVYDDELCVEVRDFNPTMPMQPSYDDQATTGRGMGLVAAVARSCGVDSLGADGKVVWFCVGEAPEHESETDPEALLAAWDIDVATPEPSASPELVEVVLASMPITLWVSARQHHDAILRELVLYLSAHDGQDDLDLDLAAADQARALVATAVFAAIETAGGAAADADLDVRVPVPPDAAGMFRALAAVFDAAERLAVEGRLLTRPGLPEIVAVREWATGQVIDQLAGAPPTPWAGTDQERFETTVHDRADAGRPVWDASIVTEATSGVIAADDANRIVAVSRPAAELLGWDVDDLVGRRVTTVIPPHLREAHVAGFSRHLTTGEAHVIGVPMELPVLTRDGDEIVCRLLIERAETAGRPIYLARVDPIAPAD